MSTNNTIPPTVASSSAAAAVASSLAPVPTAALPSGTVSATAPSNSSVPASTIVASNGPVLTSTAAASTGLVPSTTNTTSDNADQEEGASPQNPKPLISGEQSASAAQIQQDIDALLRPEPAPSRQIGLRQFFNNKKLSDVIIRFGADGQNAFHGHKVVLASVSLWFHAAFTNSSFIEAGAHELTLKDDDDEALLQMLQACYLPNNRYHHTPSWSAERIATAKTSNAILLFHVSVYTVVDKYQAPRIREHALTHICNWLRGVLNVTQTRGASPQMVAIVGLRGIIEKVYEVTGHMDLNDPLRKTILDVIMEHPATKPVNAKPGTLIDEVVKIATDIPDFGRDMFLRTMLVVPPSAPVPKPFLAVVRQVTCGKCGKVWVKLMVYTQAKCVFCGQ